MYTLIHKLPASGKMQPSSQDELNAVIKLLTTIGYTIASNKTDFKHNTHIVWNQEGKNIFVVNTDNPEANELTCSNFAKVFFHKHFRALIDQNTQTKPEPISKTPKFEAKQGRQSIRYAFEPLKYWHEYLIAV